MGNLKPWTIGEEIGVKYPKFDSFLKKKLEYYESLSKTDNWEQLSYMINCPANSVCGKAILRLVKKAVDFASDLVDDTYGDDTYNIFNACMNQAYVIYFG